MKEILNVTHLSKTYHMEGYETEVLRDINFAVENGEFVSIMGASGSGKTTLLNCLSGIDFAANGEIYIEGTELRQLKEKELTQFRRNHLGFIFQDFNLLDTLTARENIALALTINHVSPDHIEARIKEVSEQLHISPILDKYPYEISGGEKQRCACARAIVNKPNFVLADEPTGSLDSTATAMLLDCMQNMNEQLGTTIIAVTHDVLVAARTNRVLFLKDGIICRELHKSHMNQKQYLTKIMEFVSETGGTDVS